MPCLNGYARNAADIYIKIESFIKCKYGIELGVVSLVEWQLKPSSWRCDLGVSVYPNVVVC